MSTEDCSHSSNEPTTVMSAPMHVNQAPNNHGRASRVLVVDNVSQLSKVCSEAEVSSMTSHPPPTFSIPCEKDSNCDKELVSRASFLSLGSTVLPVSGQLAAAGDSTSSSINDLSFEAEQLERAIRHNDISFVRRMLELHHSRFPVDLHGSILDKSSCESHSRCVSQDVEILLRKSQTLLDRLDRQDSLSLEQDSPPVFASALHLAVECKSFDVARLLLKYGLDPNVRGPLVGSSNIWRHGSCSSTTDEGIEFSCTKGRRLSHFLSPGASRFLLNWSPSVYNENSNSRFSPSKRLLSIRPTLSSAQTTVFLGKDGASVTYEEVFTRDYLYNLPPLFLAVAVGFPSIVHLLLRFGATVNYQEQNGVSPLHLAVIKDRVPWHCVRILLECGAKVTLENKQGFSPRDLTEFDLSNLQSSLVDSALSCFISDASTLQQTINCEEPTLLGSHLRSNLLKRFHSTEKSHGRHHLKRAEFLSEEGKTRVSPGGDSSSSYHGSFRSFHSNRSISSVVGIPHEDEKMYSAVYEKDFHTETVEGTFRPGRRQSKEESRNKKLLSSNSLGEVSESTDSRAEIAVQTLTKMASNPECLSSVLTGLQIQIPAVVEMAEKVTGGLLHKPVSELLTQVLLTAVNQYREDQDQPIRKRQEQLILYLCLILRVAVSCLRGGQSLQFTALLTINKVVDVCILYGVLLHKVPARSKNSRSLVKSLHSSSFKENSSHSSRITQQHEESIPKGFLSENKNIHDAEAKKESLGKEGVQAMRRWPNSWKTPQKEPPSKGSPETENPSDKPPEENSVLGILNYEGIDLLLNVLNNAITLYKRVVGTRLQCTPSRRWRHCSYHCLQIMSARILLYMCQSEEVQERLTEDGHLKILIASLDSTNDPQLLCLVLQVIGTLALHPRYHMVLLGTGDLADCLTQLVLPSDEWYYTNHSTKYARYVKHHAGRILVYLGLEQRLRSKVYLFDIFEDPEPPPTPLQDRVEDSFIVMTSLAPSSVRDDNHQYIGMRLESVVRDMFKHIENKIVSEEYGNEQKLNSCEGDKDRRLVFLLESLPAVVHPVILLRLCQHRVLGSILYSSWRRASSRSSVGSRENRSRASSAGTEEGLRARRKVNLTIDCSSTSLSPSRLDVARRESVQSNLTGPRLLKREPICMMLTNHGDTDRDNPIPSPAQRKRSFHFSSLKRKRSKVQAQSASCSASQSDTHDTSEADIMAFQRELQNLPNFDLELSPPTSREKLTSEVISPRPRSCSVPRVTLHLPSYDAHGPLIRSATMEGTYSSGYDNVSGSGSHVQYENTSSSGSIPLTHSAVFRLLQMWATLTKLDFSHNPVMSRELRDFLARLSYLGEYYRWWAEEFRKLVDLQDGDDENEEEDDTSVINVEYHKLQQVVLNGDLPCSKEEAAVLAGIQLRIEETWPSEESAKILKPLNEDGKDGFPKSLTQMSTRRMCAVTRMESEDQGDQHNNRGRLVFHPQTSLTLLKIPKNSSILRQLLSINGNKTMTTSAINLHDCVPPLYYSTKNMVKSIKEQKRRLFHSPLYESELQLKKLYIQTCKRLPCYGCQMFHVKELLRGKTKKKATRLLGIGFERIVLLDSKTLLPAKSQLTSELQQWRTGGGRSHDRLVLEFRATKWSFITPSQGSLRSISATLWEIMQDIDSYFLDETLITTREELELANRRSLMLHHGPQSSTVYKEELDRLQNLLHFPEEVALRLTEVEYNLFYQVRPVHYIRHVTVDLRHRPPSSSVQECTVQTLTKRYNEVSSWVTHIIVSQPTHEDRKAVLSCIFRVAVCCWNFGNFNTAVEILSGLKSDKLKPFWLSLSGKERLPFLDFLSSALLTPGPTKEYKEAIERALDIPHSKVIPFFGTFLRDLKTILNGMPSLLVLPSNDTQEPELVAQFQGEDHFMSRVGVGGIINMKKIEQVRQVLDDIRAFHQHAERRHKELLPTSTSEPSEAEGTPGVEDDSLYELDIDVYRAIQPLSIDHGISFLPIRSSDIDFHDLQCMHHGTTVVHWEEDGSRSSLCFLKLERSNATLTWSKTGWSALRGSNYQDYSLTTNIEELVSSGMVMKCENSDIVFNGLEEGYLELQYIKEIRLGEAAVDLATTVSRRHGLEEMDADSCCIKFIFGACLSDNRSVEFIAPPMVAQIWTRGLSQIMTLLRRQQQMCDQRIQWVKEKYLQLFFNEQACFGPTPAEAIKVFGGRKWTLESLGGSSSSMDVSLSTFKRASSFGVSTGRMRKKKTSTSLSALRDGSPKSQTSDDPGSSEVPLREKSPLTKERRAGVKSSPPLRSQSDQTTDYRVNITHQISRPPSSVSCDNINRLAFCTPVISTSALTTNYREKYQHGDVTSSSVHGALQSVTRPTITHSSQMDFLEFTELFRSFLVRMRKDLKNLFEQVSVTVRAVNEPSVSNPKQIQNGIKVEQNKMLGLLSRNTPFDYHSNNQRKKICDAIAAASIVTNCTGVDTSKVMVMGIVEFQNFLATNQGENLSHEQVAALIKRHEPDLVMRKNLWLSFEGFARYLMDKDNYAFVSEMTRPNIEDMQHPLSHYYLASSHNTYLTGHQLKGESSVDLYSQVLLTGCRCVELDCWDGDDGIPVIYHGHTLTTKIPFKSVVEAISKTAFVTSPYPIILSLENHCSLQQQTKMAHIFLSVFGDKLVNRFLFESDFWEEPQLPSPEQLQYKVLIKNKKLRAPLTPALTLKHRNKTIPGRTNSIISTASTSSLNEDDDDEYEDDDDEDDVLMDKDVIPTRASLTESFTPICEQVDKRSLVSKSASMTGRTGSVSSQEGSGKTVSPGIVSCGGTPRPRSQNDVQDFWQAEDDNVNKARKASSQIAPELSDLVIYCQANKFRGFAGAASPTGSVKMRKMTSKKNVLVTSSAPVPSIPPPPPQTETKSDSSARRPNISASCYQVSSLNENTAKRLCKRHPLALIAHCENQLMRTYPAAMRIDSSNFNPVIFWAFGLQMVALNYQTEDSALHVNTAMFEQNGHCGYVLKPSVMWDRGHMMYGRFNPWDKEFDGLHVINLNITIISGQYVCPSTYTGSPQVEVEVIGIPVDASRQKTKLVQRNSLNPIWNDIFHFKVTFSELAFLRFSVIDVGTSHVTSQRVIPLKCLKQGYRQVRLRSPQNQPLYLSTLFIHSVWEEEGLELPGGKEEQPGSGKKVKNKVKETLSADSGKNDLKEVTSIGSAPVKRRMFFLMVHGVQSEKSSTILKITQESTTQEVIGQALTKANKSHESVNDYVLIEEVQRGWDKRHSEKSTSQRFLDPNERPLEAQAHWQGEGRFILKKLSDDPSTRAWVTTIRSSSKKEQKRRDTELTDELHDWGETEEMFLVCVYNVSPEQPYAILKAPITSTSQDIIAQVLVKARRMEDPASFVLVEQVEYPPLDDSSLSGPVRRQGMQKNLRVLSDNENVYKAQARWKAKGWFELKKRDEALHVKKRNVGTKSGSLSRLGRLRSSSRTKDSEKSSPRHLPLSSERHIKSMNDSGTSKEDVDYKPPKRVVHSEGETISDDDECKDGISSISKFKRISFRKLKAWR